MALALRFAEEGEFSRPVRHFLGPQAHGPVKIKTLIVALPGAAQQFVLHLATTWSPVGTLGTSDQAIHPCQLQNDMSSAGVILSKTGVKVSEENNTLAVLVGQEVPVAATWIWLNTLMKHVDAEDVVCLDSQLSTIYATDEEDGAKLSLLASSSVTDEMKMMTPVRALEVPQFVTGIPAALLTHGELRKRRVRVFLSLRDASSTPIDVMRSFLPLAASSSSVLGALERPMSFQSSGPSAGAGSLNVLYTFCSLTMDNQAKAAPVRQFSTRFLPNDGIPEYNALLDNHLGKRREFLLGNRHSLELMQQTGVIQRVETQPDNPNQYVVHIAEKPIHRRKRLPPRSASGPLQLPESQTMPWRQHSATLELRRSNTNASRLNPDGFLDNGNCDDVSAAKKANAATLKVKGTVEHLLESDAAFMTQIRTMKEQLADLEGKKASVDTEIGRLRRKLRGVNAVRENDVAVAHCSSIMQHRLSKAEEEFMKLVTQQQEVKKDVDRVRRELLSMRKVRQKLQEDIEDVAQANQSYEEKIYASKIVRNQLSEELSELERSAEVELEAQRLNLPPEEAVVVDVAKLMGAVKERRHALVGLNGTGRALTILQPSTATPTNGTTSRSPNERRHPKTLVDYCTAFRVLQNSMGFSDLESLEEQFTTTEEQLLSKYKANLALADEVTALEKEISAVNNEKNINRANVRGIAQASEKIERDMQIRIQSVLSSIKSYNELREQRNREHTKLRDIMLRYKEDEEEDESVQEGEDDDIDDEDADI
ncbi:hypothetical protein JG688_00015687 [Phytophthora aleatoria]|uniref:Uncharacterized protein n=1 Tax=Phytophthora aleatoria TaxID=2496075 RepID=A0A8J5I5A0_9STRA|nr:hypothetical protein JG688_00015687 [Phytophthora aleatoria]